MTSSKALQLFASILLALSITSPLAYAQDGAPAASPPATQADARQELSLSEEVLSQYVGVYQLAPNATMAITLEGGALHTQLTGQPRFALIAESETRFALKAVPAAIEFERDATGAVTAAVLQQNGRSLRAPRV